MVKGQLANFTEFKQRVRPLLFANSVKHRLERCSQFFCFKPREIHRLTLMEFLSSKAGKGSPWLGGQNSKSARRMSLGSTKETMSLSPLLWSTPAGMGMHLPFKTTRQEPIVHVLSKITLQFRRIMTLPWPAKWPDLSPMEQLWGILGRRVQRRPHKPQDINELANALLEEWRQIPQATIGRLVRSMRRRCLECLATNGGPNRYWDFCETDIDPYQTRSSKHVTH